MLTSPEVNKGEFIVDTTLSSRPTATENFHFALSHHRWKKGQIDLLLGRDRVPVYATARWNNPAEQDGCCSPKVQITQDTCPSGWRQWKTSTGASLGEAVCTPAFTFIFSFRFKAADQSHRSENWVDELEIRHKSLFVAAVFFLIIDFIFKKERKPL